MRFSKKQLQNIKKIRIKQKSLRTLGKHSDQRFRLYYLLSKEFTEQFAGQIVDFLPEVEQQVEEYQKYFPEDKEETGIFVELALDELSGYASISRNIINEVQNMSANACEGKQLDSNRKVYKYSNISHLISFFYSIS